MAKAYNRTAKRSNKTVVKKSKDYHYPQKEGRHYTRAGPDVGCSGKASQEGRAAIRKGYEGYNGNYGEDKGYPKHEYKRRGSKSTEKASNSAPTKAATGQLKEQIENPSQVSYRTLIKRVWKLVHKYVRDEDEAADILNKIMQTSAAHIVAHVAEHHTLETLDPYLVIKDAENRIRTWKRQKAYTSSVNALQDAGWDKAADDGDPAIAVENKDLILAAMSSLSAKKLTALLLNHWSVLTYLYSLNATDQARALAVSTKHLYTLRTSARNEVKAVLRY